MFYARQIYRSTQNPFGYHLWPLCIRESFIYVYIYIYIWRALLADDHLPISKLLLADGNLPLIIYIVICLLADTSW